MNNFENEIKILLEKEKIEQTDLKNLIQKMNRKNVISDFNVMQIYKKVFKEKTLSEIVFEKIFEVELYDDIKINLLKSILKEIKNKKTKVKEIHFKLPIEDSFYLKEIAREKGMTVTKYIKTKINDDINLKEETKNFEGGIEDGE